MMPSPPIDDRIDTRPSGRLPAGSAQGLRQYTRLVRSRVANLLTHHALHSFAPTRLPLLGRKPIVTSAPLQPPQAIPRGQIPIAPAAPPLHHCPRFRALALFGHRPPERVERFVIAGSRKPAQIQTFEQRISRFGSRLRSSSHFTPVAVLKETESGQVAAPPVRLAMKPLPIEAPSCRSWRRRRAPRSRRPRP